MDAVQVGVEGVYRLVIKLAVDMVASQLCMAVVGDLAAIDPCVKLISPAVGMAVPCLAYFHIQYRRLHITPPHSPDISDRPRSEVDKAEKRVGGAAPPPHTTTRLQRDQPAGRAPTKEVIL
jgi:hypothetical protein